jgi:hypothetical protein
MFNPTCRLLRRHDPRQMKPPYVLALSINVVACTM